MRFDVEALSLRRIPWDSSTRLLACLAENELIVHTRRTVERRYFDGREPVPLFPRKQE
ncbi:MAG: hypothetical protein ACE5F1_01245 [Planctomycetota bacterium]